MHLKGTKGQIDHSNQIQNVKHQNELIGFKCLHYSVTESNGAVKITVVKKVSNQEVTFGYRTIEDTAKAPKDFQHCDNTVTLNKKDNEYMFEIPIIDDEEWEPDLDFFVELYDPNDVNSKRLEGDDT